MRKSGSVIFPIRTNDINDIPFKLKISCLRGDICE